MSFTTPRSAARPCASFTDDFALEAVRMYVQGMRSYSNAGCSARDESGPSSLENDVEPLGAARAAAKTPLQVSAELAPSGWSGVLGVDGKSVWIAGEEHCLLVGVDYETQDVVHALMVRGEDGECFEGLVREAVTQAGIRCGAS